jgi:hypothetical protein
MPSLVLHPVTNQHFKAFTDMPSHALLLIGPVGAGKFSLAKIIAETILRIPTIKDYAYSLHIVPENASIGIESVRQIEQFLSRKVPGQQLYKRVIILEQAERLTTEAQNALLKNLEEPPADTLIILTATHASSLLPTIRSRTQTIIVNKPDSTALSKQFPKTDPKDYKRAYAMSGGQPGLLSDLLSDTEHPLTLAADYARQLLGTSAYSRLLLVDELAKKPELAANVTLILQQMAHISLQTATGNSFKRWQNILVASYGAAEAIATSVQPKLALTDLMLHL